MSTPDCFAGRCQATERYEVSNPAIGLLSPVYACQAHVGDLLGNVVKAALRGGLESIQPLVKKIL